MQPRTVAQPAADQLAARLGLVGHAIEYPALARFHRLQLAPGALQVGGQHAVQAADHDQAHVVGGVPVLAQFIHFFQGHVLHRGALGTLEPQLHRQLVAGAVAEVLAVQPALQVGVVPAVFTLDDALRHLQGVGIDTCVLEHGQQQVEHLALVARRGLDDEGGVGAAGVGVPFTAQGLHAFFQPAFARVVDTAEQQVFEQVRQFLARAREVVEADAHHQSDRHMVALVAGLEQHLQAVGQQVALDLGAVEGKA